ncbi:MAG: 7-cyano-7-deazaguanine synthase QueC [Candidatus Thorarchaeota archaeon]
MNSKTTTTRNAIVLLSGGLDSAICLWWAKHQKYSKITCLTFEYGSKEELVLVSVTKRLSQLAEISEHKIISLDFLADFSKELGSSLAQGSKNDLPQLNEVDLDDLEIGLSSAKSVWIPARNLIFLSIASSYAEILKGEVDIITGFNLEEGTTFPDNTQEFIDDFTQVAKKGVLNAKINIVCPLVGQDKAGIVKMGLELNVPLEFSNSCYNPQGFDNGNRPIHCGKCESCMRRKRGFKESNFSDPTIYFSEIREKH